jgi:N-acetylglucosamine-6-phosphate deacetylase
MAMMTLAPELSGYRETLARLEAVGVLPCLGHSDCNIDRITLPSGRFSITHLFNAMSPISHKVPGLAMLPFLDHKAFVELNPDGAHVNDVSTEDLRLGSRDRQAHPDLRRRVSRGPGAGELRRGRRGSRFGRRRSALREIGTLMGGRLLAPELLRNWLKVTGSSVPNAVRMLSLTPAQALGHRRPAGGDSPGLDAVLVLWKGEFEAVEEMLE